MPPMTMTEVLIAMQDSVALVKGKNETWKLHEVNARGKEPRCIAIDPFRKERVYCGTFNDGLWRSSDGGLHWEPVGKGIAHNRVTAVAVSPIEHFHDGVVWAGTEPSALFHSEDGGDTWVERNALQDIPSKPTWIYPPRPYTHRVRWIQPDPLHKNILFVAIERGGIMRSQDHGLSWEDHHPQAHVDGHTLAMHQKAPGRIYEAAGGNEIKVRPGFQFDWPPIYPDVEMKAGGFAESMDGGKTWERKDDGLDKGHYLWSIAVDPADPDTIVASASIGPMQAQNIGPAQSFITRREKGKPWERVTVGLPEPSGTTISVVATSQAEPGVFYAANNKGIFRSVDAGKTWKRLSIAWPERYHKQNVQGIAIQQ